MEFVWSGGVMEFWRDGVGGITLLHSSNTPYLPLHSSNLPADRRNVGQHITTSASFDSAQDRNQHIIKSSHHHISKSPHHHISKSPHQQIIKSALN